jgi:hypothetical protein
LEGYRVVYSLSDQNNKVQEVGLVYGLTDRMADDELVVGSENEYVYSYAATENGVLSKNFSTFSNGISYARTMEFNDASVDFFRQEISVRAYAKLKDGTYKYSDIGNLTIYSVADKLYQQNKMKTAYSHNYLFDKILSRVNADYEKVEFNWANIIVQA